MVFFYPKWGQMPGKTRPRDLNGWALMPLTSPSERDPGPHVRGLRAGLHWESYPCSGNYRGLRTWLCWPGAGWLRLGTHRPAPPAPHQPRDWAKAVPEPVPWTQAHSLLLITYPTGQDPAPSAWSRLCDLQEQPAPTLSLRLPIAEVAQNPKTSLLGSFLNLNWVCSTCAGPLPPCHPANLGHSWQSSLVIVSAGTMRMRPPAQSLGPLEKHPSPLKSLPADPASPRDTTPEPSASPSSLLCLYAKSGRGRAAGPLACGSSLSFGASFTGTRLSALVIWGLCTATPSSTQPPQPCPGPGAPKTTRGQGQGGHSLIMTHRGCGQWVMICQPDTG